MIVINKNELLHCFDEHIEKNEAIIKQLDNMLCETEKYCKKLKLNYAFVAGAMVYGTGLALSAGISLGVSGLIAGGAALSVYNTVFDHWKTKECITKIQQLLESRNSVWEKEKRLVNILKNIVNNILSGGRFTPEEAIGQIIYAHSRGPIELSDSTNKFSVNSDNEFSSQLPLIPVNNTSFKNEMPLNNYSNDLMNISRNKIIIAHICTDTANIGLLGSHHILFSLYNLFTSASVGLSFVNVGLFLYEWNKIHPTVNQILELKNSLEIEINNCKTYIEVIHRFISEGRALKVEVLEKCIKQQNKEFAESNKKLSELEEEDKKSDDIIIDVFARLNALEKKV